MTKPSKLTEIESKIEEITQAGLVACVQAKEGDFDKTYNKMLADMEDSGMADAGFENTLIFRTLVDIAEKLCYDGQKRYTERINIIEYSLKILGV